MVEKPFHGKLVGKSVFQGGNIKFYPTNEAEKFTAVNFQGLLEPSECHFSGNP